MKKQVLSFCALFGLVLVLSIYYVLLPTNLFVNNNGGALNPNDLNVNLSIDEINNLYFAELDSKLDEKHYDKIYDFESVVASANNTNEEKELALNFLNEERKIMENEDKIVSLIIELGYYNAYCEYQDDIIKVIVQASSLTNEQAAELVSLVMDNSINSLIPEIQYIQ